MRPNAIEPLKGSVESDLDPTRCACDGLTTVVVAPSLDEANADGAHFGELKDGIVAFGHCAREYVGELVMREYFQITAGRKFAHGGRMPAVHRVTIGALYEYGTVAETLGVHFAAYVVEANAAADQLATLFAFVRAVYVG